MAGKVFSAHCPQSIFFVRHGETVWNARKWYLGHNDVPLTGRGREQAHLVAQKLSNFCLQAIYTSDLTRAVQTATILAKTGGHGPVHAVASLREVDFGLWEGKTYAQVEKLDPIGIRQLDQNLEDLAFPGGETYWEFFRRVVAAGQAINLLTTPGSFALVCHGGTIRALLAHWTGRDFRGLWSLPLPPGALVRLSRQGKKNQQLELIP